MNRATSTNAPQGEGLRENPAAGKLTKLRKPETASNEARGPEV